MTLGDIDDLPYRAGAGIMLFDRRGRVFVGQRLDRSDGAWQMPQGGIDEGETPRDAAMRELKEEIGTDNAVIIAECGRWLRYDLPGELQGRTWGGKYRGQTQKWFAMRFRGEDSEIDLQGSEHPEFGAWRWVAIDRLVELIVPFKKTVYAQLVDEFGDFASPGQDREKTTEM